MAEYGPVRLTVDGDVRKIKTKKGEVKPVVDVTLMPKGKPAQPFTYWCENDEVEEFFAYAEKGVPFTVIAEGSRDDATVVDVGYAIKQEKPKLSEPEPPKAREPERPKPAAAKPADPAEEKATREARVFLARRVSLKRLCVKAVLAFDRECQSAGAPPMPPDTFWSQVTNFYISVESEGLSIRRGFADRMPTGLTFVRMEELAARSAAAPEPERSEPKPQPQDGEADGEAF